MAAHARILTWEIPWRVEPGRLESMGSQESDTTAIKSPPPSLLVRNLTTPFPLVRLTDFKIRVFLGFNREQIIPLPLIS